MITVLASYLWEDSYLGMIQVLSMELWHMSKTRVNLTPSPSRIVSTLWSWACLGAFLCGSCADKYGRKVTIRWVAVIFTLAYVARITQLYLYDPFRFILEPTLVLPQVFLNISCKYPQKVRASNVNKNAILSF